MPKNNMPQLFIKEISFFGWSSCVIDKLEWSGGALAYYMPMGGKNKNHALIVVK